MRRFLVIAILVVTAGLAYYLVGQSAESRAIWPVSGRVVSPLVVDGRWIGWLEKDETVSRLVVGRANGGPGEAVLSADSLSGLAIEGDCAFVGRGEAPGEALAHGSENALIRVTLPQGEASRIAGVGARPDEIAASEEWLVWRSTRDSGLRGVPFVVAGAPLTVVQACRREGGPVRTLAAIGGGVGPESGTGDLLGVTDGHAYWTQREQSRGSVRTRVVRASCEGGDPETVVEERGSRTAALEGDVLVWTAPSMDAGTVDALSSVKRLRLGDAEPQVIGDWVYPGAVVLLSGGRAYAYDREGLWRFGDERSDQRLLFAGRVSGLAIGRDGYGYLVGTRAKQPSVTARPLTWWARVKATLRP